MKKIAELIIKLKWLIIIFVSALTLFLGYQVKDLKIDSDIMNSLPDNDPAASLYKRIGVQFGGNDIGMIVLETDDIFKTDVLKHVMQVTDSLKITKGVSTVTSLANIIDIKHSEGGIEIGKLFEENDLPDTKVELDSLKTYVFSKDMYKGSIVSEDGTATLIMFTVLPDADNQSVARDVKNKITALGIPEKLYFGGLPMLMNDLSDLIIVDMAWLIPIAFFLIALVLLLSFRSARGVILPLVVAGIAVIWTLGLMVLAGFELSMISSDIPIILLAVGSAYTIHVVNRINQTFESNSKDALIKALAYIALPVFLAAITTAIGFVSFIFGSYLTLIRDFGMFTAIGVAISFILSITLVPAVISAFSTGKKLFTRDQKPVVKFILSDYLLKPLVPLALKHPKYTITFWAFLILISIGGSFFINTSVNLTEYFKKDNPTRVSEGIMQDKFGGSLPVFISFKGDVQSPDVLKTMLKTENYMKKFPDISTTLSVADLIEEMNDAMGEGKKIPDQKDKIEQLWFLLDGQEIMPQLVTDNLDEGIIQSKFASIDSKSMDEFEIYMDKFVKENSTDECKIEVTGLPSIYNKLNYNLLLSQFTSLMLAISLVIIIVGLMLRSFAKGIYAVIPIIATITFLFGFMGFAGISLDIATVLVGSIALGIGIDYSIHVITHFNHVFAEKSDIYQALEETILISGNAIIINVLSVSAGFLVLLFSQLTVLQNFSLLVVLSMFGSGLGALTLLPAVLILVNKKKR
ncbi:MAG: efflux RND transporter permease subunit [Bacteroidales bacterium]|jgi:hypothetical protein